MVCFVMILMALLCPASRARAQGPTDAALHGHVTAHGEGKASVVKILPVGSPSTAKMRVIDTMDDGSFLLQRIQPGVYWVFASAEGGYNAEATIELQAGALADLPLDMEVGGSAMPSDEELEQAARQPQESSTTQNLLHSLPVQDGQVTTLVQLDPAAQTSSVPDFDGADAPRSSQNDSDALDDADSKGSAAEGGSFSGISGIQNGQVIDGLSANQSFRQGPRGAARGGASAGASYGQGAVRSFRVLPGTFSARYGGSASGVLAVATQTASAHLHGSAFLRERTSILAATNPFSVDTHYTYGIVTANHVKPAGSVTQFGGSLGGPLAAPWLGSWLRSHAGGFASLETQIQNDHIVSAPASASFYQLSAEQLALLGNRGVGSAAIQSALNYLDSLSGETIRHSVRLQAFGRVDTQLGSRDEVTVGYHGQHFNAPAGAALGQASDAVVAWGTGSLGDSVVGIDAGTARWLHTFSPRWNHEVRTQLAHDLEYETAHQPLAQEPAVGPGGYAPQVSIGPNGFAYGTPSSLGRIAYPDELRWEVADDMQLRLGRHLLVIGADWSRLHDRIASIAAAEGAFSYDSGATKGYDGGLVDWITDYTFNVHAYPNGGCPSIAASLHYFCFRSYTQSFGPQQTEFVTHELAGFVEDAWPVRDGLTLTAGLRYDYTLLPLPQTPNYTLDADLAALALPVGGATSSFPEDRNNLGPRVGASWGWMGFSMHSGYGWFYGRTPGATVRAALTDTALAQTAEHIRIRPTTVTACPQVANQGFGYPCAFTSQPPAAVAVTTSATLFGSRYRAPAVQRATLSVEHELGQHVELQVSYAMAIAMQLPDSVDLNIAPAEGQVQYEIEGGDGHPGLQTGETFSVPLYTLRRLAAYGPVTALVSDANATYHAGTVELHSQPTHALEVRGSYTFSRSIDYGAQGSAVPSLNGRFDPFNHGYDKGLSSQQVPHRFTGYLLWEPYDVQTRLAARRLLNGWQVGATGVAGSGAPYSYMTFGGAYLSGGRESINGAGGATYLPTVGRNTLRLPAYGRVDLRLQRQFAVGGWLHVAAFVQAFNLLNTQSLTGVQTRAFLLGTPSATSSNPNPPTPLVFQDAAALAAEGLTTTVPFGAPRSSSGGFNHERQIEFGLRLQF